MITGLRFPTKNDPPPSNHTHTIPRMRRVDTKKRGEEQTIKQRSDKDPTTNLSTGLHCLPNIYFKQTLEISLAVINFIPTSSYPLVLLIWTYHIVAIESLDL